MRSLARRFLASEPLELAREFLFPSRVRRRAIPPLDGGLAPNDRLERCESVAEIREPDDLVLRPDGTAFVSSGADVLRLGRDGAGEPETVATLDGDVTALADAPDGALLAGVAGIGVVRLGADGRRDVVVAAAGGEPVHSPTAIAVAPDGTVFVTDGSRRHRPQHWVWDLMEGRSEGRLVRLAPGAREAEVVADGLAWPAGVAVEAGPDAILVTQAWSHRVDRFDRSTKRLLPLADNLPGYPGRIAAAGGGGFWLALFALRTHLVEFVLRQRDFRQEMMRTIHPDFWIRPDLRTIDSGLVPLQGGGIRKLGITKPWAPPRSYGLVCRLDADGTPVESLHSRAGARHHGVTAVRPDGADLWIVSRGGDRVLRHRGGGAP